MVKVFGFGKCWPVVFSGLCLVILTGCPGPGDRFIPHETTSVSKQGKNVCFNIKDAQDYQPVDIGINPRGIPLKEKDFNFSLNLRSLMENYVFLLLFITSLIMGGLLLNIY